MLDAMCASIPLCLGHGMVVCVQHAGGSPAQGFFDVWSCSASREGGEEDALFMFRTDWKGSPVDPRRDMSIRVPFFHLGWVVHAAACYARE
jgi:hypothetical protein